MAYGLIPAIRDALLAYAACRGRSGKCTISTTINTLGQVAASISVVAFALAGAMQITALAFLFTWFLSWIGVAMQVAVVSLVTSGIFACATAILILLGVLSNANSFKTCMDLQNPVIPPTPDAPAIE